MTSALILPPAPILTAWKRFDAFPMETITKAWFLAQENWQPRQRTVEELAAHRKKTGASGNCFDLAWWLLHELRKEKVHAYAVGNHLGTVDGHVAVVAVAGDGKRYLCDLGDLWILPMPLDDERVKKQAGYFTGAWVSSELSKNDLSLTFDRPGGKQSRERLDLTPVSDFDFLSAADFSQRNVSRPLVEMRFLRDGEVCHWEYENGQSFVSSLSGLEKESLLTTPLATCARIAARTGMREDYVIECFEAFENL